MWLIKVKVTLVYNIITVIIVQTCTLTSAFMPVLLYYNFTKFALPLAKRQIVVLNIFF